MNIKNSKMTRSEAGKLGGAITGVISAQQKIERVKKYNKSPKLCIGCNDAIKYEKRINKFCSHSCAAKVTNQNRGTGKTKNNCLNCGSEIFSKKYCNKNCRVIYIWKIIKKNIEDNKQFSLSSVRKYLRQRDGDKCEICGIDKWMRKPVLLILDHIDGNSTNNILSNFRLVCSNCDAQLPTYKGGNKGNGREYRRKNGT